MNKRFLMLNGFAILAVVMNHASLQGFVAMFWWTNLYRPVTVPNYDQLGSFSYYLLVTAEKLALFSVPSFLFVSGLFVVYTYQGSRSGSIWKPVKRRISNLLLPYIIWFVVLYSAEFIVRDTHSLAGYFESFLGIGNNPLFYLPLLIEYYLLSPLLVNLVKKNWKIVLIVVAFIHILMMLRAYLDNLGEYLGVGQIWFTSFGFLPSYAFYEYILYFILGIIFGFHLARVKERLIKIRWFFLGIMIISAVLAIVEAELVYHLTDNANWRSVTLSLPTTIFILSFIFAFISFENFSPRILNFFYRLGTYSLGIYLIQAVIILMMPKIIYHLAPFILSTQFGYQPVLIISAIGIPILLMEAVKHSPFRKSYRLIFG